MPKARDLTPISHPSIIVQPCETSRRAMVTVKCPRCLTARERTASEIRRESQRPSFRGYCRECAIAAVADGSHRWNTFGRKPRAMKPHNSGYIFTPVRSITDELLPMYRAMQRCQQPVMEHRWAMALHLGRALTSKECVDHMDGNKANNSIDNLRLYVKGKQQPGSTNGYGTYYHEWQMALAKIARLKRLLLDAGIDVS